MQLKAAEELKARDALPVNLRFCCDGEEETGGQSIVDFLAADERGADACVIFDAGMLKRDVPLFNVATRGLIYFTSASGPENATSTLGSSAARR
jgi:acetylornithine deacetylase/succinyl-diaminopimelate desuccinylase-like protein